MKSTLKTQFDALVAGNNITSADKTQFEAEFSKFSAEIAAMVKGGTLAECSSKFERRNAISRFLDESADRANPEWAKCKTESQNLASQVRNYFNQINQNYVMDYLERTTGGTKSYPVPAGWSYCGSTNPVAYAQNLVERVVPPNVGTPDSCKVAKANLQAAWDRLQKGCTEFKNN